MPSSKIFSLLACYIALLLSTAPRVIAFGEQPDSFEAEAMLHEQSRDRQRAFGGVMCHSSMIAVQSYKAFESNGCTGGDLVKMMNSKEDFTYCCDLHDACYQTCGMTQKMCDAKFKQCMSGMCHTTFPKSPTCNNVANLYFMATSTLGGTFYEDAQSDHCECVDIRASVVQERYNKLINTFYKDHVSTEAAAKFDMSKYREKYKGSPRKWGNLLYNLYAKYDYALIHTGSRVGKGSKIPRPGVEANGDPGTAPKAPRVLKEVLKAMPKAARKAVPFQQVEQYEESGDEEEEEYGDEEEEGTLDEDEGSDSREGEEWEPGDWQHPRGDSSHPEEYDHETHGVREEQHPPDPDHEHHKFPHKRSRMAALHFEEERRKLEKEAMRAQEGEEL